VVRHGAIVYGHAFGLRELTRTIPADTSTRFDIGSDTKQFTAAAILQRRDQRKLSLDDRLTRFLPRFPHASDITIRQLLQQTSGLPDFVATNHFVAISQKQHGSLNRIARMVAGPLHFVPGSKWEYSNTNYIVLGRVIEIALGKRFEDYVSEHLFRPAAMKQSTTIAHEREIENRARGYWRGMSGHDALTAAPEMGESWTGAAGDIVSTAGDLARWDIALARGEIIGRDEFALMTRPATLSNGQSSDYGFGWWIDTLAGHRRFNHDGDTFGFSSSNNIFPDDDLAVVVLQDEPNDAAGKTATAICRALLGR